MASVLCTQIFIGKIEECGFDFWGITKQGPQKGKLNQNIMQWRRKNENNCMGNGGSRKRVCL